MSIVQTTLVFVGIPVAFIALMAVLVYARSTDRTPRYRPGNPWQFEPVWYLPHPDHQGPVSSLPAGHQLDGARPALAGRAAEPVTATGGASGEW